MSAMESIRVDPLEFFVFSTLCYCGKFLMSHIVTSTDRQYHARNSSFLKVREGLFSEKKTSVTNVIINSHQVNLERNTHTVLLIKVCLFIKGKPVRSNRDSRFELMTD